MPHSTADVRRRSLRDLFQAAESWTTLHLHWFVWLITLTGFWLRLRRAEGTYLNGDETQLLFPALQRGITNVYRAGLAFPHGQLLNFLWHGLSFFGSSEFYFRFPSALAGALIALVAYYWVSAAFDKGAGLTAACILSFAPNLVQLSAEVRPYMLHGLCLVSSLYCLERAFAERSRSWMFWYGVSLLLALLIAYMSVWYTIAIGIYALCRILRGELPEQRILQWVAIQAAAAAICVAAYVTHLYLLRDTQGERFAQDVWLRNSYFHAEDQNAILFLLRSSAAVSAYVFANVSLGLLMAVVFLSGLGLIILGRAGRTPIAALSLAAPFAVTAAAALLKVYPYGGTRHDAFLAVFLAAGAGVTLSFLARRRALVLLLAAACLVPVWLVAAEPHYLSDDPRLQQRSQLSAALEYLEGVKPPARVLVVDQHSAIMVKHYVCHDRIEEWVAPPAAGLVSYGCGGYRLLEVSEWSVAIPALDSALSRARVTNGDLFPDPVWYVHMATQPVNPAGQNTEPGTRFGKIYVGPLH